MGYLVSAYLPDGARCELFTEALSVAEKYARHLIAAAGKRVDIYDTDVSGNLPIRHHEEIRTDMIAAGELPPIADDLWPFPGSSEAIRQGCTCRTIDIKAGQGTRFAIARNCPMHG